jgi:hypothetical protein
MHVFRGVGGGAGFGVGNRSNSRGEQAHTRKTRHDSYRALFVPYFGIEVIAVHYNIPM